MYRIIEIAEVVAFVLLIVAIITSIIVIYTMVGA